MKRLVGFSAAGIFLLGTVGLGTAFAAPNNHTSSKVTEVTGCLQQGPDARQYLVKSSNGTTWEVSTAPDVYLNNYVGETVTVTGDKTYPAAKNRSSMEHMRAYDVAVDSQSCTK